MILSLALLAPLRAGEAPLPDRPELVALMRRVTDFQLADYGASVPIDWKCGTFMAGVVAAYKTTGDKYFYDVALNWGEKSKWTLGERLYFADTICIAQTYLDLYAIHKDPRMIADIQAALERYFDKKSLDISEVRKNKKDQEINFRGREVWWWCDALFMAPPLLTRMHAATGDGRYLELLHRLYWDTTEYLYRPADKLFIRDDHYFNSRTPKGQNVYWSRGNGWVYAGQVRLLDTLPETDSRRGDYIKLFRDMTEGILKHQGEDGLWRTSLNEPSWYPEKESSGTSFFCYGLLAGVNRGWLTKDQALAPALKAWAGLQTCLSPSGKLGYAQGVNLQPGPVSANVSIDYTHGAFLLAAAELYKFNAPTSAH